MLKVMDAAFSIPVGSRIQRDGRYTRSNAGKYEFLYNMRINIIQTEKTIEPCLAFIWLEVGLRAHFLLSFPTLHPLLRPLGHSLSHPPGHLLGPLFPPPAWSGIPPRPQSSQPSPPPPRPLWS